MPMYNLLEYSKNYRKTLGSLYNYYRDELTDDDNDDNFGNIKVVNSNTFKYKNKIIGNTYDVDARIPNPDGAEQINNPIYIAKKNGTQEVELAIPLKYLGNFWRALNIPLISCEVSLELKWDKNCIITSSEQRDIGGDNRDYAPTGATLSITDCKLYVPVVSLSKVGEIKLLTNLKSGFKREIIWNKYRSQMTTEAINNNLNILIDPTFTLIQQINFIGRLEEAANVFIIIQKKENTILEFSQNFANVIYK